LGPHGDDAAFMGYTAGHPEHGQGASGRPSLPYRGLTDDEVLAAARDVYKKLQETPRWSSENDELIWQWAAVCAELNIRELVDSVNEDCSLQQ
jgi:hypothetical protein